MCVDNGHVVKNACAEWYSFFSSAVFFGRTCAVLLMLLLLLIGGHPTGERDSRGLAREQGLISL